MVGPELTEPRAAVSNALAHAGEPVGHGAIVKRDHVTVAQKNRHRIGDDRLAVEAGHAGGDQHLMAEDLHLRPLVGRDGVLQGKVADLEHLADGPNQGRVAEAVDVEPDDGPLLTGDRELLRRDHRRLLHGRAVTAHQPQDSGLTDDRHVGGRWRGDVTRETATAAAVLAG